MERFLSDRRKVFIISAGRTGTTFLGRKLGGLFSGCLSVHEPDAIHFRDLDHPSEVVDHIRGHGGFFRQIVLKMLGRTGARNLSLLRLQRRISREETISRLARDRQWLNDLEWSIYVEANHQLHGLIDDLASIPNSRVVLIVRHPEPWIQSWLNYTHSWYGPKDWLQRIDVLGAKRMAPRHVGEESPNWKSLSQAERLAWLWNFMHRRFHSASRSHQHLVQILKFEELFEQRDPAAIDRLIRTIDPECDTAEVARQLDLHLETRINSSYASSNEVTRVLTSTEKERIASVCGDVAGRLGYR